jgi:hypothetical protein
MIIAPYKVYEPAALNLAHNLTQYEWIETEQKWVKFFENDPEPPTDLPPGKFDGQIIDVENK